MKVRTLSDTNTSVKGIYLWDINNYNLYEDSDIVLYDNKLYIVINDTEFIDSSVTPDTDSGNFYIEYIKQLSVQNELELSNSSINKNLYLPIDMIPNLVGNYIKGLNPFGVISNFNDGDLNKITTTSIYFIDQSDIDNNNVLNAPVALIRSSNSKYLFRSYTSGETYVVQELIDTDNTLVFYRTKNISSVNWSNWSSLYGTSMTAENIYSQLNNCIIKSSQYYNKMNAILMNYTDYYSYMDISNQYYWEEIDNYPYQWLSGDSITWNYAPLNLITFNLVKLVVTYPKNGYNVQEIITIYLDLFNNVNNSYITYNRDNSINITTTINEDNISFTLGGSSVMLNKILANTKKNFIKYNE